MIRAEGVAPHRPAINPLRGEFETPVAGELIRFDTRLSTIAAIEAACGDRAIVEVLNAVIAGRRARDVLPLLGAALAAADPPRTPDRAERATVEEAEAFVLALILALGFKVGEGQGGRSAPLDGTSSGGAGASSASAA